MGDRQICGSPVLLEFSRSRTLTRQKLRVINPATGERDRTRISFVFHLLFVHMLIRHYLLTVHFSLATPKI